MSRTPRQPPSPSNPARRLFRRQLLLGALALAMMVFASLVLLVEVHLDEEVDTGYQQALKIAERALDAHQLGSVSASISARALEATERSRFLNQVARYTLTLAVLLAASFGSVFAVLLWRSQIASREEMGALDRMAREDGLTGVTNRRGLDEGLMIEVARARRTDQQLTAVMLDLDHFKRFNDRRGHAAGDALLRNAAQAWRRQLRPTDLLARYGGEEFTLVLPSCDADAACQLIERLRPLMPERQTFSAGVALWEAHESPEQLLARADRALLVAKKQGRNRTIVSGREPQMTLPLRIA
jgi:diguanylate cyclase (GGDEF)-like protein